MSDYRINRRTLLKGSAALAAATALPLSAAQAADGTFGVIAHAVHQTAATKGPGGDILADWTDGKGLNIDWVTYGVEPLHDQLFREAALQQGNVHSAFMLNRFTNDAVIQMFEPLDPYLAKAPIDNVDGISAGMRGIFTFNNALYGIPFRHATTGFHYNADLLAEQGLDGPPKTFEDFIEYAHKLTYTRADGTKVSGFVTGGQGAANIMDIVRAYGGDFITPDLKCVCNEPGMVRGIQLFVDLYQSGAMPKAWINFTTEDVTTFMQQGRAAMSIDPIDRTNAYNDPKASKFTGKLQVTNLPAVKELGGKVLPVASTEVWALVIPKNSPNKDLAWSFIRQLSSPDATIREAMNGNGPTRSDAYQDPRVQKAFPSWQAAANAVGTARAPLPGFQGSAKVDDLVRQQVQAAVLKSKTAQQAMDDLKVQVDALLPKA
ncbi:MAG TPA: extracellular solute-binding protein [Devosiaceae bacterium]|jgi:multiple sugar transport system substrate-binding protein